MRQNVRQLYFSSHIIMRRNLSCLSNLKSYGISCVGWKFPTWTKSPWSYTFSSLPQSEQNKTSDKEMIKKINNHNIEKATSYYTIALSSSLPSSSFLSSSSLSPLYFCSFFSGIALILGSSSTSSLSSSSGGATKCGNLPYKSNDKNRILIFRKQ